MVTHYAYIPTIGESSLFPDLLYELEGSCAQRILVTQNGQPGRFDAISKLCRGIRPRYRCLVNYDESVSLYAGWNEAIRHAHSVLGESVLHVFNDDIVLAPGVFDRMAQAMEDDPSITLGGYGLHVGAGQRPQQAVNRKDVTGTYREGGINGCAWALRLGPDRYMPQIDERFEWWGGDDDLVYQLVQRGLRCVLFSHLWMRHPAPGTSMVTQPGLAEAVARDRVRLLEKYQGTSKRQICRALEVENDAMFAALQGGICWGLPA